MDKLLKKQLNYGIESWFFVNHTFVSIYNKKRFSVRYCEQSNRQR